MFTRAHSVLLILAIIIIVDLCIGAAGYWTSSYTSYGSYTSFRATLYTVNEDGTSSNIDDQCSTSGLSDQVTAFCNKIKAARAFSILAIINAFFAFITVTYHGRSGGLSLRVAGFNFLCCAICALITFPLVLNAYIAQLNYAFTDATINWNYALWQVIAGFVLALITGIRAFIYHRRLQILENNGGVMGGVAYANLPGGNAGYAAPAQVVYQPQQQVYQPQQYQQYQQPQQYQQQPQQYSYAPPPQQPPPQYTTA